MAVVTIRQCDLCGRRSSVERMFEIIGDVDVCVLCVDILKGAAEYKLVVLSTLWVEYMGWKGKR